MVTKTSLELQDEYFDLDSITELRDSSVFSIDELPVKSYEFDEITLSNFSFEMNLDLLRIFRQGYTFLDLISDIGGI